MATAAPAVPSGPKTPLQQIVPVVLGIVPTALKIASSTASSILSGIASSDQASKLVTSAANSLLISEKVLALKDVDLAKWADWLASAGYSDRAGLAKLSAAAKEAAPSLSGADAATLIAAFGKADHYDRDTYSALALRVRSAFTELETEPLLTVAATFSKFGHTDLDLLDDLADGVAYCNHYLAPVYTPLPTIADAFEAYAAAGHDRTDFFVGLARAINEDRLMKLDAPTRASVVMKLLRAFDKLGFWPDVTEGLFAVADNTAALTEVEKSEVAAVLEKVSAKAGGDLKYYKEGTKDPEHFHGPTFGDYNLWAFRSSLIPKYYAPSSLRK